MYYESWVSVSQTGPDAKTCINRLDTLRQSRCVQTFIHTSRSC